MPKLHYIVFITIGGMFVLFCASLARAEVDWGGSDLEIHMGLEFFWIAIILLASKFSNLVTRWGQPSVLGELLVGVVIGNLALLGFNFFEPIRQDYLISFLAEFGVVILLFQVGLESNVNKMLQVGTRAALVASVGVIIPFILGTFVVGPLLLPGCSFETCLFLGAILTATSVGITARVFHDLDKLKMVEAQIVLGAAVIDDVLGLIILAVVKAISETGNISVTEIGWITTKAVFFIGGSIVLGQSLALKLGELFSMINPGVGMKFIMAVCFGLSFAAFAEYIGLAPIVGAFAAGLVLEPVHFRHFDDPSIIKEVEDSLQSAGSEVKEEVSRVMRSFSRTHIQDLIKPFSYFLVPIFFVLTGMNVKIETLSSLPVLLLALAITVAALAGKIVSGLVAGRVNKAVVGWGMVPRGEVGIIFAATGKAIGVVSDQLFSIVVIVIMLTTLLAPPALNYLLRRQETQKAG